MPDEHDDPKPEGKANVSSEARLHSQANLMVANTLETMHDWALLGNAAGYSKVPRGELAERLLDAVEAAAGER